MGWASADLERDDIKNKLKKKDESTKGVNERMEVLEKEVYKLRNKVAELMNAVMQFGDMELLDEIEMIITQEAQDGGDDKEITWSRYA